MDPIERKRRQMEEKAAKKKAASGEDSIRVGQKRPAKLASEPVGNPPLLATDERECPRCAETIKARAEMCRFCQLDLVETKAEAEPRASNEARAEQGSEGATDLVELGYIPCSLCNELFLPEHEELICEACNPKFRLGRNRKKAKGKKNGKKKGKVSADAVVDPLALACFSCGMISLIILPIVFAPAGMILSILSGQKRRANPEQFSGRGYHVAGAISSAAAFLYLMYGPGGLRPF
jgi:hypothetical protein